MILLAACLLLTPGIIALKVCYRMIKKENITLKNSIADYAVVSFIIFLLVYLLLFITDRNRTVSFSPLITTMANSTSMTNNIYQAGFIVKYCFSSLILAVLSGMAYALCKMNTVVLIQEIKKGLELEKKEEESKIRIEI